MTATGIKRFAPRFSLRTLVVFLLLVTSGMGLWWHWEPWYCEEAREGLGDPPWDAEFSPDGERSLRDYAPVDFYTGYGSDYTIAIGGPDDLPLAVLERGNGVWQGGFSPDGERVAITTDDAGTRIYRRRRPEWWWGIFYLWEFWVTVAFAGVFVWSVVRDRRALGKRET